MINGRPNDSVMDPQHPRYEAAKIVHRQMIDAAYALKNNFRIEDEVILDMVKRALSD